MSLSPTNDIASSAAELPPYSDAPEPSRTNSAQLYAPPDTNTLPTARPCKDLVVQPFPQDQSLSPRAIYGFAVKPLDSKLWNAPLESITVTDPSSRILFHFRFAGNPWPDRQQRFNRSFCALVPGPQAEPNHVDPVEQKPLRPWDRIYRQRGLPSMRDWV